MFFLRKLYISVLVLIPIFSFGQLPYIGFWRSHLTYKNNYYLANSKEDVFYATSTNIVQFNIKDKETIVLDKTNKLSDIGIDAIAFDTISNQLFIGYKNSNIDIINKKNTKNIIDLYKKNIIGNKKINHINFYKDRAYFSTGLGLLIFLINKNEFGDLIVLGNNGANFPIVCAQVFKDTIYAISNNQLYKCDLNKNVNILNNWQISSLAPNSKKLMILNNELLLQTNTNIFKWNNQTWQDIYSDGFFIEKANSSENKLILSETKPGRKGRIVVLNNYTVEKIIENETYLHRPLEAILAKTNVFIADEYEGSVIYDGAFKNINPQGPENLPEGDIFFNKEKLYVCGGAVNDNWQYKLSSAGMMEFDYYTNKWSGFNRIIGPPIIDSLLDFITAAVDKNSDHLYVGSYGGGLLRKNNNDYKIYKQSNSKINIIPGDPNSYRISGVVFDKNNNLWLSNFGASKPLVLKKEGTESWFNFLLPSSSTNNFIHQIIVDKYNKLWIVGYRDGGLFCYDPGNDIENTNDDKWRHFLPGINGLPQGNVLCITIDKDDNLWIGTENGIANYYCVNDAFDINCKVERTIIKNGLFNGFLLGQEQINCLAVDGANRKWVGTKNGAWLLSADGEKVIERFTTENSSLLDNQIRKIAIEPKTGEVFFLTFKGLCSYRGIAIEPIEIDNKEKILVFPNPVEKNYTGLIGIKNLPNNSIVNIIKPNGQLLYKAKSFGGQAVWNKKLSNGEIVAPGVYTIIVNDENNKFYKSSKIIIE